MMSQSFSKTRLSATGIFSFLIVVSFGVLAMLPIYIWGMPIGADFDNHFRFALPFFDEISAGNYIPGWLAESNNGFGDARFRFYPPNLYYLLCFFRSITGDWYAATLIVFSIFSVIGVAGVYFWARQNLTEQTAVLAALLFAVAPYHLTQFYQASLLAEYAATSLLPFAFIYVERLIIVNKNSATTKSSLKTLSNIIGLAVVYALIITTHLPTTVIASFSLGIYALLLTDWKNGKRALIFCALGIGGGLLLSSWYWTKMLSELAWIQAGEKVSSPYYDYRNNFIFSPFSISNLNTWYASLLAALTIGIFLPALLIVRQIFKKDSGGDDNLINNTIDESCAGSQNSPTVKKQIRATLIIATISLLMMTDLSRPFWAIVPGLKDIQFPYRWLSVTSVVICPVIALSLQVWLAYIKQKRIRPLHLLLPIGFVIALFVTIQDLVINSQYTLRDRFLERIEEVRSGRSFNDWLPRGAKEIGQLSSFEGKINAGTRETSIIKWQPQFKSFSVTAGEQSEVRIRSYYYPLWRAFIVKEDRRVPAQVSQAEDGVLVVSIPNEAVDIEIVFTEPPRTKIFLVISIFGWIAASVLLIITFIKKTVFRG